MSDNPNLLVFMSDQHAGAVLGCAGDPFVRTPNLDALAARGVRFGRAYCGSPLCVPSRMTFLSGRHCSEIDVWSNQCVLRSDVPTFAHALGAAGYEAILCGRMHFTGPDQQHGFERRILGDVTGQWHGSPGPNMRPIPGGTTGQSRRAVEIAGAGRTSYQAFDRVVTETTIQYLRDYAKSKRERPFMLLSGGVLPHCPFICPRELFDEYYDKVDVPRMTEAERSELHPAILKWREMRGVDGLSDEQVRTARAAYYGLVTYLDEWLGRILETMDETGLSDDTAVFYTSDHGDMAGKHEMWWKSSFYEDSVGVPLIAAWPGRFAEGAVVDAPVSLLDFAPTLCDLAGAEAPPFTSGRSLAGVLRGEEDAPMDRPVFSEQGGQRGSRMVVRWPWKLNLYHGMDAPQLFNLADDPGEEKDLGKDRASADVVGELTALALDGWFPERAERMDREVQARLKCLRPWYEAVRPDDPAHWENDESVNVFPE